MRKDKTITIEGGRDDGRKFYIKEMGALKTEKWASKAIVALLSTGIDIPGLDESDGIEGLMKLDPKSIANALLTGMLKGLKYDVFEPLLDEMLSCMYYQSDLSKEMLTVENIDTYIEDVKTILTLRKEVITLHVGFDIAGKISNSLQSEDKETKEPTENTQIFPGTSET